MGEHNAFKLLFVINPGAGSNSGVNWQETIAGYFAQLPHIVYYFILDDKHGADELEQYIKSIQPDRVIAVGGDGTVTLVSKLVMGTSIAMGIIPAGSANGMAKELNIPAAPADALDVVVNGNITRCDLIGINDSDVCLHLSDIGLNARLIKYFEQSPLRGKLGYARVLFKTLYRKEQVQVLIRTEKEEIQEPAFMVVLANASKYGTGAVINPLGAISDGFFEVVIVKKLAISELLKMMFSKQRFDPEKIQCFRAREVNITTARKVHFQIDGEYKGKVYNVKAKILPGQISIILPQ
ncbi:diacylglycerol kinase family protein [uncultured Chitinophaga sp.]|jgi:Sphingosine kinase and enzymes related to eukaryotic diacylglycerol kinase|uniref:diacylglycerol/lipid kinase family protein n=1 Tax=uncultured Chitinophaga sp. TaxID=339340 RepID=UPI00261368E7|nr:diacylglycerol kinase family protein [uncultured Chitinophaga sp.]